MFFDECMFRSGLEPFDRTNTARSVYDPAAFQKIVDVFRQSAAKISQTKDLSSVMT